MNQEDIIHMALESKSCVKTDCNGVRLIADGLDIERFAALVAAASEAKERAACAEVCDRYSKANMESDIMSHAFDHCAKTIRARGQA